MKINDFRKVDKGKLRAFFSIEWPDKLIIYDMKLMENDKGELWAATPARQYEKDGVKKWAPIVRILDHGIIEKITMLARKAYDGGGTDEKQIPF